MRRAVEWIALIVFALVMLVVTLWPLMPYVIGWLVLFDGWRLPT